MSTKVVLAKAHENQLSDAEIKKEFESISELYKTKTLNYRDGTINFVFVKGLYKHCERKMITICLFVNKMSDAIKELHGILKLEFKNSDAKIAKATINFDEAFMGTLCKDEALLVHIGIPVKGLNDNDEFTINDINGNFSDVRVTFV